VFEVNGSVLQDKQVTALEIGACVQYLAVLCLSHKNYFFLLH